MVQFLFIGTTELLLIGGIALLLFGGKKLPEMMRGLGQGVKEFKKGVNDVEASVNDVEASVNDADDDGRRKDGGTADAKKDDNKEEHGAQGRQ